METADHLRASPEPLPRSSQSLTGVLPESYWSLTGVLLESYQSLTGVLPESYQSLTGVLPQSYRRPTVALPSPQSQTRQADTISSATPPPWGKLTKLRIPGPGEVGGPSDSNIMPTTSAPPPSLSPAAPSSQASHSISFISIQILTKS